MNSCSPVTGKREEASINEVTGITELPYGATARKKLRRNDCWLKMEADSGIYISVSWCCPVVAVKGTSDICLSKAS